MESVSEPLFWNKPHESQIIFSTINQGTFSVPAQRNTMNFYFCRPGGDRAPDFRGGEGGGEREEVGYFKQIFTANNKCKI